MGQDHLDPDLDDDQDGRHSGPTRIDAAFLATMPFMLNVVTDFGIVNLTFTPSGPPGQRVAAIG